MIVYTLRIYIPIPIGANSFIKKIGSLICYSHNSIQSHEPLHLQTVARSTL